MSSDQNGLASAVKCKLPDYLNGFKQKLEGVPAGHRHTIYWNTDGTDGTDGTEESELLRNIADSALSSHVSEMWKALRERSDQIVDSFCTGNIQVTKFPLELQANLLCGSGLSHLTEVGMSFMNPYGIPYIPGSSIKGVLRDAAQMLADNGSSYLTPDDVDSLFGRVAESEEVGDKASHNRGHLRFLDSLPQGSKVLGVDIITPHHREYYQGHDNACSPHDEKNPVPIPYLVVKKGTKFDLVILHGSHATSEEECECSKKVSQIVEYATEQMGFGAKTSIGYGWMKIDERKKQVDELQRKVAEEKRKKLEEEKAKAAQADAERKAERESLNEDERWAYDRVESVKAAGAIGMKRATIVKRCLENIDDSTSPERLKALGEMLKDKIMERRLLDKSNKKNPAKDDEYQASVAIKELTEGKVPKWGGQ
ncbi:MAG: type III-B CRISPR module RAMP protein Cmr6 [Actinobacteria bacterium]|nr:type III-B CRISPR module RAMP protein Cmr6 [Actinomycetota bacterium]